jgi:hypothetical protein
LKRILVLVALLACFMLSCENKKGGIIVDGRGLTYQNLTEQWHVLNNLQVAMHRMEADHYVELLDTDSFVFRFDPNDVRPGDPTEWGFAEDSTSAAHMLEGGGSYPIVSIDLELVDFKNAQWTEFDPSGSPGLYRTTVQYNFSIATQNDISYVTGGTPSAEFTIAERDIGGQMVWRIVEWKDHTGYLAAASPASSEASSWGKVKSLYR